LSSGQIDGGKDIFHPGLLGIKAHGKKVLLGVISYFDDTSESRDGGAHGVRAAASHKSGLLDDASHPEIYASDIHGESSVYSVHPAFAFIPTGGIGKWGKVINFTKFCFSAHHCRLVPRGGLYHRLVRVRQSLPNEK
jgi:hypothetical protein